MPTDQEIICDCGHHINEHMTSELGPICYGKGGCGCHKSFYEINIYHLTHQLKLANEELELVKKASRLSNKIHIDVLFEKDKANQRAEKAEKAVTELVHALRCADNSFVGSPGGQKQIDHALSIDCGQSYLSLTEVQEKMKPVGDFLTFIIDETESGSLRIEAVVLKEKLHSINFLPKG